MCFQWLLQVQALTDIFSIVEQCFLSERQLKDAVQLLLCMTTSTSVVAAKKLYTIICINSEMLSIFLNIL